MNLFFLSLVFLIATSSGAKIHRREENEDVCPCLDSFEKVDGVPFKCLLAEASDRTALEAKEYCEERNAILYEPDSNEEVTIVNDHFHILSGNRKHYYVGYARKEANIACANAEGEEFYSVTTCQQRPNALAWISQPDNAGGSEFCLEYLASHAGMNDVPCDLGRMNRIVCQFSQECPSSFKKVDGIHDKCFMVVQSEEHEKAIQAKEYCENRNGVLYEPKSKNEMEKLDNHFAELGGKHYFVGYAEKPAAIACSDAEENLYHSISTCDEIKEGLRLESEPENEKKCVKSIKRDSGRGLVSEACADNDETIDYIVCQFNKFCGPYTEPESVDVDYEVDDENNDEIDEDNAEDGDDYEYQLENDGSDNSGDTENDEENEEDDKSFCREYFEQGKNNLKIEVV